MVKDTIKSFYNLVDNTPEALKAALEAFEAETVEQVAEEAKQVFGEATLADGESMIYFEGDTLSVGSKIYADEELTQETGAAEYVLENGDTVITDDFGNVIEILPAGEESPVEEEASLAANPTSVKETTITETNFEAEEVSEETQEENFQTPVEEILMALEPIFNEQKEVNASLIARLEALEGTSSEAAEEAEVALKKVEEKVEKLSKMPAATPYTGKGNTNKEEYTYGKRLTNFEKAKRMGGFKKH